MRGGGAPERRGLRKHQRAAFRDSAVLAAQVEINYPGGRGRAGVCLTVGGVSCPHSGSAGRVVLSREDKEAAKLGLSVFTVIAPKCPKIS